METVCKVIKRFGECGYAAVDCENRVDMTQMQSVMDFCDSVENQKEAEVTIIQVSSLGGFSVYHLQTENGVVHVKRCYYGYKDGIMKSEDEGEYQTDYWRYTDDGYLMFLELIFRRIVCINIKFCRRACSISYTAIGCKVSGIK